jgi:hypothetical protein
VKIIGSKKTVTVRGTTFQYVFGLRSTLFTVRGSTAKPAPAPAPVIKPGKAYATFPRTYNASSPRDLLLVGSDGRLRRYPVSNGKLGSPVTIGTGFGGYSMVVNAGDWNGDGYQDVIVRTSTGRQLLKRGTSKGTLAAGVDMKFDSEIATMTSVGDVNGDRFPDLAVITKAGNLWLFYGNGKTGRLGLHKVASGWGGRDWLRGVGDWNHDRHPDLIVRVGGSLRLYRGTGSGFGSPVTLGTGWSKTSAITSIGDFDADGWPDILARTPSGQLRLYSGHGKAPLPAGKTLSGSYSGTRFAL